MICEYMVTKQHSSSELVLCFRLVLTAKAWVGISVHAHAGSYLVKATEILHMDACLGKGIVHTEQCKEKLKN